MTFKTLALCGAAAILSAPPAAAQPGQPAPVAQLVGQVDIPYEQFTLANGLRVVVHTDRKAPIVAVSVWYDVGAKHEPAGKTGFAHLFEHLMFNGSENAPGDFFEPLKQIGATDLNGTTYFDRTNYFETVPTAALDRALFLESDRMGYLLGAITQGVLDEQRGVVQNEKRQGDNQPYGLLRYAVTENLFPAGHPYAHDTIGSMADLDAASLQTVKDWFRDHYGPNNAVLVLAGDIDARTARPLVEKYFGAIRRGPQTQRPVAPVPTLPAARTITLNDRVAQTMVSRYWAVPGVNDADAAALDVAASVLGGMASSRLTNQLVRKEQLFVQVGVDNNSYAQVGTFEIYGLVRPGVDPAVAARRLDAIVADFLRTGPTQDEVTRAVTGRVVGRIRGLESVGGFGGKAVALAEGALYSDDPGFYKKQLEQLATVTPAQVRAVAGRWLGRPALTVDVVPGQRAAYAEAKVPPPAQPVAAAPVPAKGTRGPLPAVAELKGLSFPAIERATLSNGIKVVYARRTAVPMTTAVISFDAGIAADVANRLGTQSLTISMLDEGIPGYDAIALAEARERLGAAIGTGASPDRTTSSLSVPSVNLVAASSLWSGMLRAPTFPDSELPRVKAQQLAGIQQELTSPYGLVARVLPPLVVGTDSPYAKNRGQGDAAAVTAATRGDLAAFHQAWLRPDKARIFVTSDRPLAELTPVLERAFGDWRATGAAGTKTFGPIQSASPKIVLVDRPDSPQSIVAGGTATPLRGRDDLLPAGIANDALGGDFLSRINMNLREDKHWSYGAGGSYDHFENAVPYTLRAGVQADKTGASLAEMRRELADYVGARPMTQAEFDRAVTGAIRSLPGDYETSGAILGAMQQNDLFGRPDDYQATLPTRLRALTIDQVRGAVRNSLDPKRFVWVVVGDAAKVRAQLDTAGLPVEVIPAGAVAGGAAPQAAAAK
ncbi:zinc protease [Sphingomonas metalli]|uniref:Zinc protease n=1 Tax=Sphingomonas metalli TaxID=1779358 RepID=A0A916T4N3_9SPHN|nr:pitrilysin family protein [Sphingomonas metalli]GGB29329.1 zinc protease [Sphingomonas metalli]